MGRFANLANVRTNMGGVNFVAGNYNVKIRKIEYKDTRKGPTFIVETEVIESDNQTRGPGSKPSWVVSRHQEFPEYQLADMKHLAGVLFQISDPDAYMEPITEEDRRNTSPGSDPQITANNRFWEQALEWMISSANPCAGIMVKLNCTERTSTKTGKTHLKHTWGPIVSVPGGQL